MSDDAVVSTVKVSLAMTPKLVPLVFSASSQGALSEVAEIDWSRPPISSSDDVFSDDVAQTELLLTGWGVPRLGPAELDQLPRLRAVVHWGGDVSFLDGSAAERGITVSTGRTANAIPVAQFTLAMIVLAAKDAFWVSRDYTQRQEFIDREDELFHTGLRGRTIGLVGASSIGTLVMEMLQGCGVRVLVYDPFATRDHIASYGAELVDDLEDLARRSSILSIHAPAIPSTRQMISQRVLAALPQGATLINTARGALIDQDALVAELQSGRLRAVLDVTEPDVLPAGHPLYTLPNVFLTPHLAGSTGSELNSLGEQAVAEVIRFAHGQPFAHPANP